MTSLRQALLLPINGGVVSLVGAGGKTSLMFKLARELSMAGEPVLTTTTTKILEPSRDQSAHLILSNSVSNMLKQAKELAKEIRISINNLRAKVVETAGFPSYLDYLLDYVRHVDEDGNMVDDENTHYGDPLSPEAWSQLIERAADLQKQRAQHGTSLLQDALKETGFWLFWFVS